MKLAYISINYDANDDGGYMIHPNGFEPSELLLVRNKGVIIEKVFSKTVKNSYFANICPHCNSFVGDFYIHDYYGCKCAIIISSVNVKVDDL